MVGLGDREGSFIGGREERAPLGSEANVAQPSELRLTGTLSSLKKGADCNVIRALESCQVSVGHKRLPRKVRTQ